MILKDSLDSGSWPYFNGKQAPMPSLLHTQNFLELSMWLVLCLPLSSDLMPSSKGLIHDQTLHYELQVPDSNNAQTHASILKG